MINETKPSPMFLALTPDPQLDAAIQAYKDRVHHLVGPQLYLDHPPHMTVYLAVFPEPGRVIDAATTIAEWEAPSVDVVGWHVFESDPLTGNHTLVFNLSDPSVHRLRRFQTRVVRQLGPLRDSQQTCQRFLGGAAGLSDEQIGRVRSAGFPYIGEGWHPHFTVASIRPADWPPVEAELLPMPPEIHASCSQLAVYQLVDEHPHMLKSFALGVGREVTNTCLT